MGAVTEADALAQLPRHLRRAAKLTHCSITQVADEDGPLAKELENVYVNEGPARDRLVTGMRPGRDDTALLREAWRAYGYDVDSALTRQLVERGIAPLGGGMPVGGSGMAFVHNVPAEGRYIENTDAFFQNTERNDIPQPPSAFPGFGAPADYRIPNVGVLAGIRAIVKLSLVVAGGGTVTSTYQWPWNVAKRISLNANGQTQIISAEGVDLRARRQRFFRNPREEVSTAPATDVTQSNNFAPVGNPIPGVIANGTYAVVLVYDIPICHDDYNMAGALYAQSDQNSLQWRLEAAASSDLFTLAGGSTATLTGTVYWTTTVFDIPSENTSNGRTVLLPDMKWIHGFLGTNQPYANTGEVPVALIRTTGQLLCTYLYLDNGGLAQIDPLALTEIRFQYGGNRRPRTFNPTEQLIEKNGHDYNGRLRPGYIVLDNEVDNPTRDLVLPKGVTELQVVTTIAVGTTINANAHAHFAEETMFVGRAAA